MGRNQAGLIIVAVLLLVCSVFLWCQDTDHGKKSILDLDPTELHRQERYIHVVVALCDNINQGIVKVPKRIGNGQDPANNLYWGCGLGIRTFFIKHKDWKLIRDIKNPADNVFERLVFRHVNSPVFLVADAYDGAAIRQTISDFLGYSAGHGKAHVVIDQMQVKTGGNANLICYVGHNGLMDFTIDVLPKKTDEETRDVMIMACLSRDYFFEAVKKAGARPLLWTTGLMCPEAYTLAAAIASWIRNEPGEKIRENAAQIYNQYQKCGIKGARNLFVTGY